VRVADERREQDERAQHFARHRMPRVGAVVAQDNALEEHAAQRRRQSIKRVLFLRVGQ